MWKALGGPGVVKDPKCDTISFKCFNYAASILDDMIDVEFNPKTDTPTIMRSRGKNLIFYQSSQLISH